MSQLQHMSLDPDERRFLVFRASVLSALGARRDLRRLGVLVQRSDGLRLIAAEGVSSKLELWSWLIAHAYQLVADGPRFAALVIPKSSTGRLQSGAIAADAAYDLDVWMVDDDHRVENTGFRCTAENGDLLTRLPWRTAGNSPSDAVAALLASLLAEHRDPPPAPMRLLRPARNEPPASFDYFAAAAA